jgi:hypothetical protein
VSSDSTRQVHRSRLRRTARIPPSCSKRFAIEPRGEEACFLPSSFCLAAIIHLIHSVMAVRASGRLSLAMVSLQAALFSLPEPSANVASTGLRLCTSVIRRHIPPRNRVILKAMRGPHCLYSWRSREPEPRREALNLCNRLRPTRMALRVSQNFVKV